MKRMGIYFDSSLVYPMSKPLYRPTRLYPECPFEGSAKTPDSDDNDVYDSFRQLMLISHLDEKRFGTALWNPLGEYIQPGDHVLIKPNLVMDNNPSGAGVECLYTHPSLIAAVIDYVFIALSGKGKVVLADAPVQQCDFDKLTQESGLDTMIDWYRRSGLEIELRDLRGLRSSDSRSGVRQAVVRPDAGVLVDLGDDSSFANLPNEHLERLRITNYDPRELRRHHFGNKHEYLVAKEMLDADVVINMPKPKTHRKAGVTAALKNFVGINVRKEYLPHHAVGAGEDGYDEYRKHSAMRRVSGHFLDERNRHLSFRNRFVPFVEGKVSGAFGRLGKAVTGDAYSEGSWWGNDTIWRTILDLNKIVHFADKGGTMCDTQQRKTLVISDMVVIGEGEGPLLPEAKPWGMLMLSEDPVAHDIAVARLFGTDVDYIPSIREAVGYSGRYRFSVDDPASLRCVSNYSGMDGVPVAELSEPRGKAANPSSGWAGHFIREVL